MSICIGNDIIYKNYKDWVNAGITSIKDIFDIKNCSFMNREELERMYNINISIMKYNQIISAIPRSGRDFYRHHCSLMLVQEIEFHINVSVIYKQ